MKIHIIEIERDKDARSTFKPEFDTFIALLNHIKGNFFLKWESVCALDNGLTH